MGELERIKIFLEVAEQQSFAKAARRLNLSPSVVTRQVGELEATLGTQLFVRTTRQVALTKAGESYAAETRPLAQAIDQASEALRAQQTDLTGALKVSAPLSLGLRLLPDIIAQFRLLHPKVELTLDLTDRFIDIMDEGYDMALRVSGPPSDKSTIWRKICPVPRSLVASPTYLARRGTPKGPMDLKDHDCLGYSNLQGTNLTLTRGDETVNVPAHHPFQCNNGEMIAHMARRDEGVALLPDFIVAHDLASGALVSILQDWAAPPIWLTAFYPPYARLPVKVATLTEFVEAQVAERGI
ncbi:DNA-binding transcriptional LysR family regulator [Litoreibacter ponti]|uniref:DNA-binding transcriptional LysR family regulator n=1 Tax=Litoreibacter ponti TaxID=1510457 RepID=A0A2T6BE55_9RHOB|nr:LysR family transcriptional regulator [Litoreibacter ponti]PTX54335.1 DNA-binding transcriptional LysR family regulator [Litoreibacter ponti]